MCGVFGILESANIWNGKVVWVEIGEKKIQLKYFVSLINKKFSN